MKFKEFYKWCDERVHDGYWGLFEAIHCIDCIAEINKKPF